MNNDKVKNSIIEFAKELQQKSYDSIELEFTKTKQEAALLHNFLVYFHKIDKTTQKTE